MRQLVHRARATVRGAVTAITPYPVAEWLSTARSAPGGDRVAEIVLGASSASAGGLALKLGAVVVSGVAAASVVSSQPQRHASDPRAVISHRVVSEASVGPAGGPRSSGYSIAQPVNAVLVLATRSARQHSSTMSVAPHGGVPRAHGPQHERSGGSSAGSGSDGSSSGAADGRGESGRGGSSHGPTGDGQDGGCDRHPEGTPGVGSTQGGGAQEQSSGGGHDGQASSGGGRVGGGGDGLSASAEPVSGGGGPSGAIASAGDSADAGSAAGKDAGGSVSANDSGVPGSLGSDSADVSSSHAGDSSQGG